MKEKQWFKLVGLKISAVILRTITFGIPKLVLKIEAKVKLLETDLEIEETNRITTEEADPITIEENDLKVEKED